MLLADFYTITAANYNEGIVTARVQLNAGHAIFDGHFPGMPVVPGVCQLQMMEEVVSHVLGKTLKMKSATQVKFLSFVNPAVNSQLDIQVKIGKEENGQMPVEANYSWEQTMFLKFKGIFNEYRP